MTFRKAYIFDLDGVLVDVRQSYVRAALETVAYLQKHSARGEEIRFTRDNFHAIKHWGGFNNDWDLTLALWWLCQHARHGTSNVLCPPGLREDVLGESTFRQTWHDQVMHVFQQFYLGRNHFELIYRVPAEAVPKDFRGFIATEKPWLPAALIHRLPPAVYRVLLTGRPRPETLITLQLLGLREAFHQVFTDSESMALAKMKGEPARCWRKPATRLARFLEQQFPVTLQSLKYFGDTKDDYALASGFQKPCVFVRCAFENLQTWGNMMPFQTLTAVPVKL